MAKDNSNKLNLISNKISKDLSRTEYERAINFFYDTNSYMMINDINLSIKEMIDLINNNDRLREMIIVVFNSNLNDILEGNFSKFENNNFLMNLMVVYYMMSNYNAYREVNEFEQEIDKLSPEMKKYYKYVSSIKRLSNKEEQVIIKRMKNNDKEAKKIIIESYLKVIFQLTYVFCKSSNEYSFEDLIQDANVELVNAVEKYDWENGHSFYNYLRACIESRLNKVCMNYSNPFYLHKTEESLSNFKTDYIKMNGRKPSIKEINGYMYSPSCDFEDSIVDKVFIESLKNTKILNENYRKVLSLRYGLEDGKEYTQEEVGKILGVTRQRVCKIELEALTKLCQFFKDKKIDESVIEETQKVEVVKKRKKREIKKRIVIKKKERLNEKEPKIIEESIIEKKQKVEVAKERKKREIKKRIETKKKERSKEKDIYTLIFETLKKDENKELLKLMSYEEAVIYVLKNGLVNNKEYSCEEISNIINMDVLIVEKYYESSLEKYEKSKNKALELLFRYK